MDELLLKERLETRPEGDQVVLKIGNTDVKFHYEVALKLAQWLRVSAKQAKLNAGDYSRHWSLVATLDHAE
jgi:hypothetical protein